MPGSHGLLSPPTSIGAVFSDKSVEIESVLLAKNELEEVIDVVEAILSKFADN
ncbi:MAG: hypothetical protein WCG93_12485 [Paludibacter sp.]